MSEKNVLLAPIDATPTMHGQYGQYVASSWSAHLIEAGLGVTLFDAALSERDPMLKAVSSPDAMIIPHHIFNTRQGYPMNFQTLQAIQYARNVAIPLLSEIPLADHLRQSEDRLFDYRPYQALRNIEEELGEIVIGQHIDIIQEELGVA